MSIHIVVHSVWGTQRVRCFEGLAVAVELAGILHRASGREVEVVETDDATGKPTCRLALDTILLPADTVGRAAVSFFDPEV